jgi:hypothetical protein
MRVSAACVTGMDMSTRPAVSCASDGSNDTVTSGYVCMPGYFVTAAPVYCTGMPASHDTLP